MNRKQLGWWVAVVIGMMVVIPGAEATESRTPAGVGWTIQEGKYTGEVNGEIVRLAAALTIKVLGTGP